MNDPRDRRYLVTDKPVARRAGVRQPLPPAAVSPLAQERALAARSRQRLGAPLSELLRRPDDSRRPVAAAAVIGGVLAAGSGIALFLGWLQGSPVLAAIGGGGGVAGLATWWVGRRRPAAEFEVPQQPLFDAAATRALDAAMVRIAPEIPADIAQQLADLKQSIVRIGRNPAAAQPDEHFTFEDRMYVVECVRRYLPDGLQAYLGVPKAQRLEALADGQTPHALLVAQLEMLRAGLAERETKLARSAAEALLQQERFLKAKR